MSKNGNQDPRHKKRIDLMKQLFAYSFEENQQSSDQAKTAYPDIEEMIDKLDDIDKHIQNNAPERPLDEVNKVDLAIMRLIMFESRYSKTPIKVLINEGIELAKEFGSNSSPRFINGVLGKLLGENK